MRLTAHPPIFRGNWAALLLPLNADDSIDYGLLSASLDHLAGAGVDGVYSNGSAGEFYAQTETEFDRIHEILAEKSRRLALPFQIGATHMSAQTALERLRRTRHHRPAGFQVILPDWFPPTRDEIFRFLEKMTAAADPVPLVVYNPPHAKVKLAPADWLAICEHFPGVAGIKVPGGDVAWYEAMKPVFKRLSVFIPGHTLATGLGLGAHGAYSNVACLSPGGAQAWYQLCQTDPAAGLRLEVKIQRLIFGHVAPLITERGLANMAADKALAVAGGWLPGLSPRLRWPYAFADDADVTRIARIAREMVPELFDGQH